MPGNESKFLACFTGVGSDIFKGTCLAGGKIGTQNHYSIVSYCCSVWPLFALHHVILTGNNSLWRKYLIEKYLIFLMERGCSLG